MSYAGDVTPEQAWTVLRDEPGAALVDVRTRAEWSYVGLPDLGEIGKDVVLVEWQTYPDGAVNERFWALATAPGSLTAVEVWDEGSASVAFTNRTDHLA